MNQMQLKAPLLRAVEAASAVGYFLVIASIAYFILGAVTGLVGGDMMKWTFCGSAHYLFGANWCDFTPNTGWVWGDNFVHKLVNAVLPWVMMVAGLALLAICLPTMRALGFQHKTRDNKDA